MQGYFHVLFINFNNFYYLFLWEQTVSMPEPEYSTQEYVTVTLQCHLVKSIFCVCLSDKIYQSYKSLK